MLRTDSAAPQLPSPCAPRGSGDGVDVDEGAYSVAAHLVATAAILASALIGYGLPVAGKHAPRLRRLAFVYVLGKCLAVGVVLSVALVHMLQPANAMLTHACASPWLRAHGQPLAYVLCLAALLAMYTIELLCSGQLGATPHGHSHRRHDSHDGNSSSDHNVTVVTPAAAAARLLCVTSEHDTGCTHRSNATATTMHAQVAAAAAMTTATRHDEQQQQQQQRWLSAVLLECGASAHSVFVGFAVGVCAGDELASLATALVLHQFFEGIAIGASVAEAALSSSVDVGFALLFATAAPLGACAGVAAVLYGLVDVHSATYLAVQGVVDAVCAGVLLYIGASLLLVDFPRDVQLHAAVAVSDATSSSNSSSSNSSSSSEVAPHAPLLSLRSRRRSRRSCRAAAMLTSVLLGAAIMCALGWYL